MSHPDHEHMYVNDNLYGALRTFVVARRLGRVLPPGSYELTIPGAEGDTVRAPDLTILAKAKLAGPPGAIGDTPELAVEIYSPNDRPGKLKAKLADYQLAGWNVVWVIYPPSAAPKKKASTIEIYHLQESLRPSQSLTSNEELKGEGLLAEFSMPVAELFDFEI